MTDPAREGASSARPPRPTSRPPQSARASSAPRAAGVDHSPEMSDGESADVSQDAFASPSDSAKSPEQAAGKPEPEDAPGAQAEQQAAAEPASMPLQKRRRVTRACDECRRKKIKCDGKQPCTHCSVYSYGAYNAYRDTPPRPCLSLPPSRSDCHSSAVLLTGVCRVHI